MRVFFLILVLVITGCGENPSHSKLSTTTIGNVGDESEQVPNSAQTVSNTWEEGDIIFQTSLSSQSKAIQLATHSTYSHVGIVLKEGDDWVVFEAVQPVKTTRLEDWIHRGADHHYVVKRLVEFPLGFQPNQISSLKAAGEPYLGKNYDVHFGWGNEAIYCSELVWKLYQEGLGVSLCQLRRLSEFDLSDDIVRAKMVERYGDQFPLDELVVSPEDLFQSELLIEIEIEIEIQENLELSR